MCAQQCAYVDYPLYNISSAPTFRSLPNGRLDNPADLCGGESAASARAPPVKRQLSEILSYNQRRKRRQLSRGVG